VKRKTTQRQIILETLQNLDAHPSAEELFFEISKKHSSVGKSTVYRNLRQLSHDNVLGEFSVGGIVRFDKNPCRHYHYICDICGKIFDIEIDGCDDLDTIVQEKYGLNVRQHEIEFFGTCNNCTISTISNTF